MSSHDMAPLRSGQVYSTSLVAGSFLGQICAIKSKLPAKLPRRVSWRIARRPAVTVRADVRHGDKRPTRGKLFEAALHHLCRKGAAELEGAIPRTLAVEADGNGAS